MTRARALADRLAAALADVVDPRAEAAAPEGRLRRIYEGLGVSGDLAFAELNPDGYDHVFVGPANAPGRRRFDFPAGRAALEARLVEAWPREKRGIRRFLDVITRVAADLAALMKGRPRDLAALPVLHPTLARWGLRSLRALLDATVADPALRAVLAVQSGDNGLPPSRVPVAVHAAVAAHYLDGGWYPVGGARSIPRAFIRRLRSLGGRISVRARVDRILLEEGRAAGVELADGTRVTAREVVSNADPAVTWGRLLRGRPLPWRVRRRLARSRWSVSNLSLFLAAEADGLGLDSGNRWWLASPDIEAVYPAAGVGSWMGDGGAPGEPPGLFLTDTTLKDPPVAAPRVHTLEAFTFVPWAPFARWADSRHGERPADYLAVKARLEAAMLAALDRAVPGLRERVVFHELATPLTNRWFCEATRGAMYGTEKTRWQVGPFAWPVRTPIPGLVQCGASTLGHGVMGATLSGLAAARALADCRTRDLLAAGGPPLRTVPAERPETWPADLPGRSRR